MTDIILHEGLWACSMLPEGIVERWLVSDGETVSRDQPLAAVRIEDALHEVCAPASGRLAVRMPINAIVEPGSVLGAVLA